MPTLFFTGYPGFLGSELLPRLLRRAPDANAVCLVQPKFASLARERAKDLGDRVRLVESDITSPIDVAPDGITEIWHLAAIYDLSVTRTLGMRVNVGGTRNMLDFAQRCRALQHFHYISTCYVSGNLPGVFREDELERGQSFNNYYEETKYLAELEVRKSNVPWTIYRPAVIVGDSMTGATQKFDGPYFVMQWLERQPRIAVLPVVGRPSRYTFNVVPRDFMVNTIEYVSDLPQIVHKCYQLADPAPLTVDETINVIARATGRRVIRIPLTKSLAKFPASSAYCGFRHRQSITSSIRRRTTRPTPTRRSAARGSSSRGWRTTLRTSCRSRERIPRLVRRRWRDDSTPSPLSPSSEHYGIEQYLGP